MEFPSPDSQKKNEDSVKKVRVVVGVIGAVVLVISILNTISQIPGFHCVYEFPREGICAGMNYSKHFVMNIGGIILGSLFVIMAFNKKGTLPL